MSHCPFSRYLASQFCDLRDYDWPFRRMIKRKRRSVHSTSYYSDDLDDLASAFCVHSSKFRIFDFKIGNSFFKFCFCDSNF